MVRFGSLLVNPSEWQYPSLSIPAGSGLPGGGGGASWGGRVGGGGGGDIGGDVTFGDSGKASFFPSFSPL